MATPAVFGYTTEETIIVPENKAGPDAQEVRLSCPTRSVLQVLTAALHVRPNSTQVLQYCDTGQLNDGGTSHVFSAQLLLSLFAIDTFAWGVGKAMLYELVLLAEQMGWCYLKIVLVLTTLEVIIEFIASSLTPRICMRMQRSLRITPKVLVLFALRIYLVSNTLALICYPPLGVVIHVLGQKRPVLIYALSAIWCVQYAFLNQVGDTAVEMSKPHWLQTFQGTALRYPGIPRCYFERKSSDKNLQYFLTLMRFTLTVVLAGIYLVVRKKILLRWSLVALLLVWGVFSNAQVLRSFSILSHRLVDQYESLSADSAARSLCSLRSYEISFIVFVVSMFGMTVQASSAMQNVILLELPTTAQMVIAVVSFIAVVALLIHKVKVCSKDPEASDQSKQTVEVIKNPTPYFGAWLLPMAGMVLLIAIGTMLLVVLKGVISLITSIIVWLPVGPLLKALQSATDTFLQAYDVSRSSDLVYWVNVLKVVVNVPLLLVNWLAVDQVGCNDKNGGEIKAASGILICTSSSLIILLVYYSLVDPRLTSNASLQLSVDNVLSKDRDDQA